ncbi:MAG: diaminopimelate decarboxylase [Pseudomonadota bacterium]
MHHFTYRDTRLHAEDVDLTALADEVGTPFYVYCEATLRRHYRVFADAFDGLDALVAYSVKANSNLAVLSVLASEGAGADVVSAGELHRALKAGVPPEKIVFSGVGKTRDELAAALDAGIFQFNIESENELEALATLAEDKGEAAPIALRVNPDVAAGGHDKISTGKAEDKFGVAWSRARALYAKARDLAGVRVKGVDMHIGSQITDLEPFETAFSKAAALITDLRADGIAIDRLDIGGGLGIPYETGASPPPPEDYAAMVKRVIAPLNVKLIMEPGRVIAGNAGALVARVTYVKDGEERRFAILDAAMNDLLRPALYDARHEIWPLTKRDDAVANYDVVGPVCETGDRFAKSYALPTLREGDLVAFMTAGAYGAVLSSQYNTRPLVPEVLVNGDKSAIIRRRPTVSEILAVESVPDWVTDKP